MRHAIVTAAILAALPAAASANLLVNGDFEQPGGIVRDALSPGSLPGWSYDSHGTGFEIYEDDSQDGLAAADGSHYVSFGHSGASGGSLSQTVATTAGHAYRLSLWTAEQQGDDQDQMFNVLLTTAFGGTYTFNIGHLTATFTQTIQDFFPDSPTTITITDATPGGAGGGSNLALDRLSIVDITQGVGGVPEPAAWALMVAGFAGVGSTARRRRRAVAV